MHKHFSQFKKQLAATFFLFLFYAAKLPLINKVFAAPGDSIFGTLQPPAGVERYNEAAGGNIGLIVFLSNIIRLATVAAGIWTMINFVTAGWLYLTSEGDPSAGEKVSQKLINSIMGLMIVALAYTIAGIIGLLIFGDATFIINPEIRTIEDVNPS